MNNTQIVETTQYNDLLAYSKKLILSFSIVVFIFSGCTNQPQPFNPNKKGMIFIKGNPYMIPYNVKYLKQPLNKEEVTLYKQYKLNCKQNDIFWFQPKQFKNHFTLYKIMINNDKFKNLKIIDNIKFHKSKNQYSKNENEKILYILNNFIKISKNDNITFGELRNNKKIFDFLNKEEKKSWLENIIKFGYSGCASIMSDKEYHYFVGNQRQQAQFQHENDIQSQKSSDKSLDRLNDTINSMTPKTYNINHSGSINLYHY